jgi:H+/Cl- antiporter ClcA
LSSPVIVVMLILELFRPGGEKLTRTLVNTVVASSVSIGIYFAVAGSVFLDIYMVPQYSFFKSWQLLVGVALGVVTAVLVMGMVLLIAVCARAFTRLRVPRILKPVIGGALFGVIGVTLPLTMFSGADQLTTVINDAPALGTGLVLTLVVAKIFTLAVNSASGFVGGPVFPALFIGGRPGSPCTCSRPGFRWRCPSRACLRRCR